MEEKKKFGYLSQVYVAPRAENVEVENEGLLLSSSALSGTTRNEQFGTFGGNW